MNLLADAAALLLVAAGVAACAAGALSVQWGLALAFALDLWTGAAVLALLGDPSWPRIATASLVVLLRCVALARGLARGRVSTR